MNPKEESTLKSWATGKLSMFLVGLAAGYALYKFGVISKLTEKFFSKKEE
jgi:hypothetical protein